MLRNQKSNKEAPNLLLLTPERLVESCKKEDGLTYLVIPRFQGKYIGKFLLKKMRHPTWKVDLDEIGTYVWELIDGKTTVEKIGNKMKSHFGDKVDPVYDRLNQFFFLMRREGFIRFQEWQGK